MKKINNVFKFLLTRTAASIFFIVAAVAFAFLKNATWTHNWIAELYPLGNKFVPVFLSAIAVCMLIEFVYLIVSVFKHSEKQKKALHVFNVIYIIAAIFSVIAFFYTLVLFFGLDSGISMANIGRGLQGIVPAFPVLGFAILLPLALLICDTPKKTVKMTVIITLIAALTVAPMSLNYNKIYSLGELDLPEISLKSENILEKNSSIVFESLKKDEKPDAAALLNDGNDCWTPQDPNRLPAEGYADANNSYVEISLAEKSTFNTAIIDEVGNQVQYFRLQAKIDGEWVTIYQSEKIQAGRLCSFDAVTTDSVRLSIDKFRSNDTPAQIKSIRLYNEPQRDAENFEVTSYQRLDSDVPSEILAKGESYVNNYARFYDVYSTIIVFGAVHWDENGQMSFGDGGEEKFAKEIEALKEIIAHRPNKAHKVKIIVTALADGTWDSESGGVNAYMTKYWESIADKIVEFVDKYEFDGVDIDWEYPQTNQDWHVFDNFIARLDDGMQKTNPEAIISGALSAGCLGMTKETLNRFDQIQFMAYDGRDTDGYQSSLEQAEEGLKQFIDNGADIKKINIGIAAYGRPINLSPYWGTWRDLEQANYWDNKYYNVITDDQLYDGTFCSPALAGDKTAYAIFSGAGGVMVFRVDCDKTMDNKNSVTVGIENALNRYVKEW